MDDLVTPAVDEDPETLAGEETLDEVALGEYAPEAHPEEVTRWQSW